MALENRASGKFISIYNGKLCQRVPTGTTGAVERTNKNGKSVAEKYYDSFTGRLVGISVQDSAFGKMWNFSFKDKGDVYTLSLNYSSSFARLFLVQLPNVDLTKEMTVSPSQKEENGKNKSSLFVKQDGITLKHAYSKTAKQLPVWEQIVVKGVKTWDNTKELDFLWDMVQKDILPKLEGNTTTVPADEVEAPEEQDKPEALEF